jgi:protein-disulfide isomerase
MDKRFLGILAAIVIIFIGIFAISQNSSSNNSGSGKSSGGQVTHHVEGGNAKGVTLQEYGDYECPICEAYYLPLKQAVQQYSSDIQFQFSNLPLTSIHQNAFAGARAAEAAGLQNKFWQMHDKLYENQNGWASSSSPLDIFSQYAQQIGLNVSQFKSDYASGKVNDTINADLAAFDKTHQDKATPTFFLNGKFLPNSQLTDPQTGAPADKIGAVLKAAIDKQPTASSPSSSGTSQNSSGSPY